MARQRTIMVWTSEDGEDYPTEIAALRADVAIWKTRALQHGYKIPQPPGPSNDEIAERESRCSGPGGGTSRNHP